MTQSGIDFDFLIGDGNDNSRSGPARRFVREAFPNSETFDYQYVLALSCESEQEAIAVERDVQIRFGLFGC